MRLSPDVRRVIVVVLDGLRPDAIDAFDLVHIRTLMAMGAWSRTSATVAPSITTAAMTSLLTGVSPRVHGIRSDHFVLPWSTPLVPLPALLTRHGLASSAFMAEPTPVLRGFASYVGRRIGFGSLRFSGRTATEVLFAARSAVRAQRHGLIMLHWPDADRAGHQHGWMSDAYGRAAQRLDDSLGLLAAFADVPNDPTTLLVALADHGGGGAVRNNHDSDHPRDRTIPIVLAGGGVVSGDLGARHLLDVPPTVLSALGVRIPPCFEGRALDDAFTPLELAATAVA